MTGSRRIPLLIVGGGIGGLATALAASQAGVPAHVIEKSAEFEELGAGLQLAPNAMWALDRLGLYQDIRKHAFFPKKLVLMDALSGEPVATLNVREKFQKHFGYPYIVVHRGDLLSLELEACRASSLITLESSKDAVRVEDLGDGARVTCADGTIYECDALIGADGLRSRVRRSVHDDGDPICARCVCYRGAIPIEQAPAGSDFDNMTIWVGPDIHYAQYVIHHGTVFNQVAVFRSARYTDGSEEWGSPDEFREHFSGVHPRLRAASATIKFDRRWPMFDRRPIDNWTRNRITLMGDAAHPMFQYLAQGANQALEDAACLKDMLREAGGDFSRAFLAYQRVRIPRTARVQNAARFAGELFHVQGAGRVFRNLLLAKRSDDDVEYLDWVWGYRGWD
jgi:salicylate hydroxylase